MIMRFGERRWCLILAGLAIGTSAVAWAALPADDSPEAREIKERFSRQAGRIASLEVSYSLATRSDLKPTELLALSEFRNKLYLPGEDWTEAIRGEKRFRRVVRPDRVQYLSETDEFGLVPPQSPNPKDPEAIQKHQRQLKEEYDRAIAPLKARKARGGPNRPKGDPGLLPWSERDVTRGYNGRSAWMRHPIDARSNEVQVWPVGPKALHFFGVSPYLSAIGLQPADPTAEGHPVQKAQEMFRLTDWFQGRGYAIEKTEVIDGSTCVVLKGNLNGMFAPALIAGELADRTWLDRDHGGAVRRREQSKDGRLLMRWENSGFREVEPGLWLPTIVRREQFADDAPAEWRGKPVVIEEVRVDRIEVNRVPDERFDMVPAKTDVIEDLRGKF